MKAVPGRGPFIVTTVACRVKQFPYERLRHHSGNGIAVFQKPNERPPKWDARNVGARAVDRIDDPDMPGPGSLGTKLLAKKAVFRKFRPDQTA